MRSVLCLAAAGAIGCAAQIDLRLDESISSSDRALALRMSELTRERCVRQQYDQSVSMTPTAKTKISALPVVKRLYASDSGWVKAEITVEGAWDNIYFLESKNSVICGEPNWQKLTDSSSVRFYDIRSQSPRSSRAEPVVPPVSSGEQRAIAFRWEGEPQLIAGIVTIQQQGRSGRISAKLPSGDGECTGMYEAAAGGQGQWAMSCTGGLTVVGTFRGLGPGKGSVGSGQDSKCKRVEFTLAGTP